MGKLKTFFSNKPVFFDITAVLIVLLMPFSSAVPNLLLIPLAFFAIFTFKKNPWPKKPLLIYILTIAVLIVLALFNGSFLEDFDRYSKYLLVVLLFFLFAGVKNKRWIEYALLMGTAIVTLVSFIAVVAHQSQNPGFLLDSGSIVNELLLLERPYLGCMLFLSVFICLKNAEKSTRLYDYYILSVIFAAFSIYISARLAMTLIMLLFFVSLFRNSKIAKKTKLFLGLFLALLVAISFGLSDNLMSRMHVKQDFEKTLHLIKAYEPRFVIWPCAIGIVQQDDFKLLTGLENYDEMEQKLTACYAEKIERPEKQTYYLNVKFNTHNQFLNFLLIGGLIPFLLLIAMFFWAWFSRGSFEFKLIFVLFFAFFLVENVLHRQLGCYLFGIFAALYSKRTHE